MSSYYTKLVEVIFIELSYLVILSGMRIECEYMLIDDYIYVDVYMLLLVNIYVC